MSINSPSLSSATSYMNISTRPFLMDAFFKSQFSDCSLAWMCHISANSKINRLHQLCLQIIFQQTVHKVGKNDSVSIQNHSQSLNSCK